MFPISARASLSMPTDYVSPMGQGSDFKIHHNLIIGNYAVDCGICPQSEVDLVLLGSTILTPFQLRPDFVDSLFYVFCSDSTFVDLDISFVCTFRTPYVSGHSLICSPVHTSLCFLRVLCFHHLTFSRTLQFLCCRLLFFAYRTQIPVLSIHQHTSYLVYKHLYLIDTFPRTNITFFSLVSSEVLRNAWKLRFSSGHLCLLSSTLVFPARILVWTVDSCSPDSPFRISPRYIWIRLDPNVTGPFSMIRIISIKANLNTRVR